MGEERATPLIEEISNSLTCGLGLLLSIAGLVVLVTRAAALGDAWQVVSFSIYGTSLILLFTASMLYHAIQSPRAKSVFEIFDQSAIYLLIAGSYTPFALVTLRGPWGWSLFGVIWGLAVAGIVVTWITPLEKLRGLSCIFYLAMGWLIIIGVGPLMHQFPARGVLWLAAGGLIYSAGVAVFFCRKIPFSHTIWHLFVLSGALCHFLAVLFYVE